VDVGANVGVYTYFLHKHSAICHSFEPSPDLSDFLRRSFPPTVHIHSCALSNRNTEVTLSIPVVGGKEVSGLATIDPDNRLGGIEVIRNVTVPCWRLDEFEFGPVGFIKIDVEGHELAVLQGAERLLEQDSPTMLVECEERHKPNAVENVRSFLAERGYNGFFLMKGRLKPISAFDPALHQNPVYADNATPTGVYVNNFLFVNDKTVHDKLFELIEH